MTERTFGHQDKTEIIPENEVRRLASQISPDAIMSPKRFDDAQVYRERLVRALARLTVDTKEYLLNDCDTLIIDQKSGNLPGLFFKQLSADIYRKTGKVAPLTHDVVGSLSLPGRKEVLEKYFREAFKAGEIGNHILIVTEHAISRTDKALVTFADIIKKVGAEFGKEPEIRIAAVSIGHVSLTRLQQAHRLPENNYHWYAGELGYSIGSLAFHRDGMSDLAYQPGSARPRMLSSSEAGPHAEAAKADMIMLAHELAPLAIR